MANCEETPCVNVQSAICLHCSRRLCAPHVIAHGTALLKEGDELCEEINHLSEHLNFSLQKIHKAREEAMHKLGVWRQDQIDKIEYKFAEKTQAIEFRKDDLTHLENELMQRLKKEAKQPLDRMQVQQNASSQGLQLIRQNIAHITRDSAQLDLCLKELSSSIPDTTATNENHLLQYNLPQQEYASTAAEYYYNSDTSLIPNENQWYPTTMNNLQPLINLSNLQSLMTNQCPIVHTTSLPNWYYPESSITSTVSAIPFASQTTVTSSTSKPGSTITATAAVPPSVSSSLSTSKAIAVSPPVSRPQSAASASSKNTIKRPPINSCRNLIKFFKDVSGFSDLAIQHYIIQNLHKAVHVNNIMILFLSLLEAWNSENSLIVLNERILIHHIKLVKKYIKEREHELTVIAAIQVFTNSCKYDETKLGEIMITLLQFFFDNDCFTKETVLDWYKNGAYYGYNGFSKAKLRAKPFIDQLNSSVESKSTSGQS